MNGMKAIIPITAAFAAAAMLIASAGEAAAGSRDAIIHMKPTEAAAPHAERAAAEAAGGGKAGEAGGADLLAERQELYDRLSLVTGMPWQWIAAFDAYERSLSKARPKARPLLGRTVGVYIDKEKWAGPLNPDSEDSSPVSIQWFQGIGRDGDGNGMAERTSDFDLMYSLLRQISAYGISEDGMSIGAWHYYRNSRAVQRIRQFAAIYNAFGRLDLDEHAFPLPIGSTYSYKDTWGDRRGWGGRRIHEGTDIFAGYGTPVRSTCYGIVEIKGWNRYGGWRIGIRDLNNHYHYYAHLSGFDKSLRVGDVVKPGQTVGWVGSSGYGKPGTSGKFPPHLHYGVYSDRGLVEWAFDPYPMLRRWEAAERKRLRSKR